MKQTFAQIDRACLCCMCSTVQCDDGEVRLDGGVTKWEGRVEVCFDQRWYIVGGEEWSETNSHVMCNVLGYDIPGQFTT